MPLLGCVFTGFSIGGVDEGGEVDFAFLRTVLKLTRPSLVRWIRSSRPWMSTSSMCISLLNKEVNATFTKTLCLSCLS